MKEGVALCLGDDADQSGPLRVASATLTDRPLATA
jgi:hypothetical protein